ncbi:MarR family winged helix-turn-helix transcriptional regulator [Frankia gtarii]|uniref:MarR family winged helix-turn-helix transcriptional regulator n=1 Tax=Frankia gtarii TaxID=2950102 RepID=UPI0021C0F076|nr:MarR family transcriptional regulator [Frankia gtarii]
MESAGGRSAAGYLVWRLSLQWRVAVDRAVAPLGLTHARYVLLSSLYGLRRGGQAPSQRRLAEHTGLEALYVSKLARALEADGLLTRDRDPVDARAMRLVLTDRGVEVARAAIDVVQRLLDQLLAPLGGLHGERADAFVADLTTLLATPLLATPPDAGAPHAGPLETTPPLER